MKINVKLIAGFFIMALLVGFVGIFGITTNNTIQENGQTRVEVIEFVNLIDHSLVHLLQLIETQNLDDYHKIKSNIEDTRKDSDVLHEKIEDCIHRHVAGFHEDIEEFIKISNLIIKIHKEKIIWHREFNEKKNLGWPEQELEEIAVRLKGAETEETKKIEQLRKLINKFQENEKIIATDIHSENESLVKETYLISLIVIIISIIISIVLGLYIAHSISKPIQELTKSSEEVKKGNLNYEIKIKSKDEIGELAETFDEMRLGLKDRSDLLNSLMNTFKGKFGSIATILVRKNVHELVNKNPRIEKILPKSLGISITRAKKLERESKKN